MSNLNRCVVLNVKQVGQPKWTFWTFGHPHSTLETVQVWNEQEEEINSKIQIQIFKSLWMMSIMYNTILYCSIKYR